MDEATPSVKFYISIKYCYYCLLVMCNSIVINILICYAIVDPLVYMYPISTYLSAFDV